MQNKWWIKLLQEASKLVKQLSEAPNMLLTFLLAVAAWSVAYKALDVIAVMAAHK